jgi:hypothetical protein
MTLSRSEVDGAGRSLYFRRPDPGEGRFLEGVDRLGETERSFLDLALRSGPTDFSPGWTTLDLSRALQTEDPHTPELYIEVDRRLDRASAEELRRIRTDAAA